MAIQISLTVKDDGTAVIQSFGQRVQDLEQKATGAAGRIQQAWGAGCFNGATASEPWNQVPRNRRTGPAIQP